MQSRTFVMGCAALLWSSALAVAQAPTPTPVDSDIAVSAFAQSTGQSSMRHCSAPFPTPGAFCNTDDDCPSGQTCTCHSAACPTPGAAVACSTQGGEGCGGCYPTKINPQVLDQLPEINPEWQPIGPMINGGPDTSVPPDSQPVTLHGTVALTKINIGGDFSGSHVGDDQNTFIALDPADNILATGNESAFECGPPPGENCNLIEMELEFDKYPLFAWAGEGDRITAEGRWIFDCGHPDPQPYGGCSNNPATPCVIDSECGTGNQCNNPPPTFNYRSELHPPRALAVLRNKSKGKTPATRADVFVTGDGGGAGNVCTVTHLASSTDVLFGKNCFVNHCSKTTGRSCKTKKDCASSETCLTFDPTLGGTNGGFITDINDRDFEFDMPLPPTPTGVTNPTLKTKVKPFKVPGGIQPKPILTTPTPGMLHVVIPMTTPVGKKMPNRYGGRVTAYWKEETTKLTHLRLNFLSVTINNPLKRVKPAMPQVCTKIGGGLSPVACSSNSDCPAGTCASDGITPCHIDKDCTSKTDFCQLSSVCVGGIPPAWDLFGEVNGDWVKLPGLSTIGNTGGPFAGPPPYTVPSPAPTVAFIKPNVKFDEYVPEDGTIHIASTGRSQGCNDLMLYGRNVKDALHIFGLDAGATCLGETDPDPGRLEIVHTLPDVTTDVTGATCGAPDPKTGVATCTATPTDGNQGGTCSINTTQLCVDDTDCLGICSTTTGRCQVDTDCKHCSGNTLQFCTSNSDCTSPQTCVAGTETCDHFAGTQCMGTCSAESDNAGAACHVDGDCIGTNAACQFGPAWALTYTIQIK